MSPGAQDVVDCGALHRGLFTRLSVSATGAVLVLILGPGVSRLAEHLDDGRVPGGVLQSEKPGRYAATPAWSRAAGLLALGSLGLVVGVHRVLS
ncbi:hypothetical protein ACFYNY_24235 [Streptomyces sp. NPDC006530]|uniref:hypothetical protein n=1 Tax=Streptomyces sp. NPDC006530 TaxID=3364750 RepID=UPI0036C14376